MNFDGYRNIRAINWSTLKEIRRSPLHYLHALNNRRQDTPRLGLGRAFHTALLEPERFAIDYAVFPGPRRAGKEWVAFVEEHGAKTILKVDEYDRACRMRDAILGHPVAREHLSTGAPEVTLQWTDPGTGLACKGRADWLGDALVDLKSTKDVSARRFGSIAGRFGYHCQMAFYLAGVMAVNNPVDIPPVVLLAVEDEEPHDVAVYRLDDDALYAGQREVDELLAKVAHCNETGEYPGQYPSEQLLPLPPWVWGDEEQLEESGLKWAPDHQGEQS